MIKMNKGKLQLSVCFVGDNCVPVQYQTRERVVFGSNIPPPCFILEQDMFSPLNTDFKESRQEVVALSQQEKNMCH